MLNKKNKSINTKDTFLSNIPMIILTLISVIFLGSIVYQSFSNTKPNKIVDLGKLINKNTYEKKTGHRIKVEVLNGCGQKKIALMFKRFLREEGYDVIDAKNATSFDIKHTKIVYHTSQIEMAKHAANLIGVNDSLLINEYNLNLMHDLTIIIGKDFNELNSFELVSLYYPM